ncbi:MAG: uridine kinase [Candidatus Zophobacter franzmannii]|nr:uridine kinase [Candidatus Zophobacter franzmannii]
MINNTKLILISGGTCSGKTTITREIEKILCDSKVAHISQDNYYRDLSDLPDNKAVRVNFDHPDSIDHVKLLSDIRKLLTGETVRIPDYDFITHKQIPNAIEISDVDVIVLEGIFCLFYMQIVNLADLRIYVDADADIRLARRINRDIQERGYTIDSVLKKYLGQVKPMHEQYIEPSKKNADLIIPGEKKFDKVLGILCNYLSQGLK